MKYVFNHIYYMYSVVIKVFNHILFVYFGHPVDQKGTTNTRIMLIYDLTL